MSKKENQVLRQTITELELKYSLKSSIHYCNYTNIGIHSFYLNL